MKRLIPSSLKTFLAANPNVLRADCFAITLPTGQVLYATDGQFDITFKTSTPGWSGAQTTFRASQYGLWKRGRITSEAGFKCASNSMDLTCVPQMGTNYPGLSIGILAAALNHLFDAATVWIYTAYMPFGSYGDVSNGIETKWQGTITKIPTLSRNLVQFECADPMYLLNMKVPSRLIDSNCGWAFADSNCGLDPANYTVDFTAGTVTQTTLQPTSAFSQADGYFAQGVVTCLTGLNAGLSQTVKTHKSGVLTLVVPWILPVAPGDTFAVIKGCDKTPSTCAGTLRANGTAETADFRVRYGGQPYTPPATAAF